jgi:hypothetical protein
MKPWYVARDSWFAYKQEKPWYVARDSWFTYKQEAQ